MANTSIIVTMIGIGVCTAVGEEVCNAMGKGDIARWLKVGGVSLAALLALGIVISLINQTQQAFAS